MIEPYTDEIGGNGVLYYSDEKVADFCKKANRAGLQIELHAIGDKAFDQAARAIKAALDDYPRSDHRHGGKDYKPQTGSAFGAIVKGMKSKKKV